MTEPLTPEDAACLRMLAGASFLGGNLTLPSGRVLTPDEAQALTSAYAPAVGEVDDMARQVNDVAKHIADLSADLGADMAAPRTGTSPLDLYLPGGGNPENERTMALLREASRPRTGYRPANPNQHRNGIPWYAAPLPRRWHRCAPWTTGSTQGLALVERCACGATRLDGEGHPWMERNSRRSER